eukprot:TRINITY_DN1264_c2_g3_i2.p1 TRINITY_DN1264_c2_g3~~TRINITY_DN1264_c2_g3_i2.p1  ORF type:complete len:334 (-),score=128.88 TRINITY_DN1264_c2_g3_i2:287-1288(-)
MKINAVSHTTDTVCVSVHPTEGVQLGNIPFFSFLGCIQPINVNTTIVNATDGDGYSILNQVWIEKFNGGKYACQKPGCKGVPVNRGFHTDLHPGDINVCLECTEQLEKFKYFDECCDDDEFLPTSFTTKRGYSNNDDDDDYDDCVVDTRIKGPINICFRAPGLTEAKFMNSLVKVRASDVCGFCVDSLHTTGVLQECSPDPQKIEEHIQEEECEEKKEKEKEVEYHKEPKHRRPKHVASFDDDGFSRDDDDTQSFSQIFVDVMNGEDDDDDDTKGIMKEAYKDIYKDTYIGLYEDAYEHIAQEKIKAKLDSIFKEAAVNNDDNNNDDDDDDSY